MLTLGNVSQAKRDFEAVGAAEYIRAITASETKNASDMDAIIHSLGGTVRYAPITAAGMLPNPLEPKVWIREDSDPCTQQITKAHEIAHYFLNNVASLDVCTSWGSPDAIIPVDAPEHTDREAFCDYFAHVLIGLPDCLRT